MTYVGRVRVSYGPRLTRLEKLRSIESEGERLAATLWEGERLWERSDKSQDQRRETCTAVAAAVFHFVIKIGVPLFVKERLNDLFVALDELRSGRHSGLLAPAPVHPLSYSITDLMQQAMAQVCVDLLREAGFTAADARRHTAALFEKHKLPKFSESKLRAIGSRLKGAGCTQDPAHDLYAWASGHAEHVRAAMMLPVLNRSQAKQLTDKLVALTKRRDHRHEFFFAPREDSSAAR